MNTGITAKFINTGDINNRRKCATERNRSPKSHIQSPPMFPIQDELSSRD
jgi:hypothetical protein